MITKKSAKEIPETRNASILMWLLSAFWLVMSIFLFLNNSTITIAQYLPVLGYIVGLIIVVFSLAYIYVGWLVYQKSMLGGRLAIVLSGIGAFVNIGILLVGLNLVSLEIIGFTIVPIALAGIGVVGVLVDFAVPYILGSVWDKLN